MIVQPIDYFRVSFLILTAVLIIHSRLSRKNLISKKEALKERLKTLHNNQPSYLCYAAENLGNNLIQFYGEPFCTSVRPGMKIYANNISYTVKEVYADDKTPDQPDPEITSGMEETAVVIETNSFDWNNFNQKMKDDGLLALKIE